MFKLNLKISLRNLWKHKGYTLINVGGLAIGLASCMILLLYVAYEWGYDKQFKDYDKTYLVYNNSKTETQTFSWAWSPSVMAKDIRETIPGVAYASHSSYPEKELLTYKENSFKKAGVYADPDFLKILDYKFIKGNPDRVLAAVNSVILTESMARNLFGDEDPINKTVKLEDRDALKVEAVIADVPANNSIRFDYLMPWALYEQNHPWIKTSGWGNNFCLTLIQLKDSGAFPAVSSQMKDIYRRHDKESSNFVVLHPLSKWHLYGKFENGKSVGGRIDQVKIFFLLAFCILLIACVNFMNLSTARSEKRAREVGVRKAIGSSRKSLMGQFMLESVWLALMGMLVAFVLIEVSLPYFNSLLNIELRISYGDWKFWSTLLGLTLFTGLIAGSYPAFYLSSFEPVKVLKGLSLAGNSSLSVRKILVVFQFVFAACLIVCTVVIYEQLNYVKNKPIGYNKAGLLEIPIQGNLKNKGKLDLLEEQLLKSGAVSSVTYFSRSINESGHNTFGVDWPGKGPKETVLFNYRDVGPNFTKTVGSKMILGREFLPGRTDSSGVVVNEAAVKVMGLKQPVGAQIRRWGRTVTIIGVMKDFVMESPYQNAAPMIVSNDTENFNYIILRLNPVQNITASITQIDDVFKEINPAFPSDRHFVSDDFQQKFGDEQLLGTLSNWFGGFALLISCLGLLGLALYMAEQRKKEISIRKVLGAGTRDILTLLNKDFIKLVAIANLIAFPLAYLIVSYWLSSYSFRVSISAIPFIIAIGLSLCIAILTVSMQSVKVVKANPVDALKYE